MALRVKTVEYAFPSYNGVAIASGVRYDFAAITLYIPEIVSRTFHSVRVQFFCRDASAAATNGTTPTLGILLGAVAFDDLVMGAINHSGESWGIILERDVTSYFSTNFGSGGSQTCQVGFVVTGPLITNLGAKLIITYEYEENDGNDTRLKTVRIPLESQTHYMEEVLSSFWGQQIPALDSFLPEGNKVYREIWLELMYNEGTTGVTVDSRLGIAIDAGAEHLTGIHESGMASSCFGWYAWRQDPGLDTSQKHELKLRSTGVAGGCKFYHPAILLVVTYEYNETISTRILNSLLIGFETLVTAHGNTSYYGAVPVDIWIEEPGPITLKQSAIMSNSMIANNLQTITKAGDGPYKSIGEESLVFCGQIIWTQRIDQREEGENLIDRPDSENSLAFPAMMNELWPSGVGSQDDIVTSHPRSGIRNIRITKLTAAGSGANYYLTNSASGTAMHGMIAGGTYTFGAWIYLESGSGILYNDLSLRFSDTDGLGWNDTYVSLQPIYDAYQYVEVTKTLRSNAIGACFGYQIWGGAAAGAFFDFDDVSLYGPPPVAALQLKRGRNHFKWQIYLSNSTAWSSYNNVLYLNYESNKHELGSAVHNHSIMFNIKDSSTTVTAITISAAKWFHIPEEKWFLMGLSFHWQGFGSPLNPMLFDVMMETLAGELDGAGLTRRLDSTCFWNEGEAMTAFHVIGGDPVLRKFRRWAEDFDTQRLDVLGTRGIAVTFYGHPALSAWLTYHSINFEVNGQIMLSGGGSVEIKAFRNIDNYREEIARTSRVGDGSFSMTVYDNTEEIFVEADDGVGGHGRSESGLAE